MNHAAELRVVSVRHEGHHEFMKLWIGRRENS